MGGSYDSDSSEEEFNETNVLLGYASKDPSDVNEIISKIGGTLDPLGEKWPSFSLFKCANCAGPTVQLLQLNAELPDRFPNHERRLWIYICLSKKCRRNSGSIRAVRGVRVDQKAIEQEEEQAHRKRERKEETGRKEKEEEDENKRKTSKIPLDGSYQGGGGGAGMGEFLFGSSGFKRVSLGSSNVAGPVGAGAFPTKTETTEPEAKGDDGLQQPKPATMTKNRTSQGEKLSGPFSAALKLGMASPPPLPRTAPAQDEPWPDEKRNSYPTLYLVDAEYEILDPTPAMPAQNIVMDIDPEGGGEEREERKEGKNAFDSAMDSDFQKFADRVGQNPEQVIRYEFGGQPLLYSRTDATGRTLAANSGISDGVPRCNACGSNRVFEVQMTPHAITELEGDSLDLNGMDWGTIIVGVCERDCVTQPAKSSGSENNDLSIHYCSEWVGVQWEDLGK